MEYRSKFHLLGLPLIHIATAEFKNDRAERGIARGWVAIGDISFGIIFSVGGVAFGGIAVGGLAVGGIALAGLGLGIFSFGGGAVGIWACGGGALAWKAAFGGLAVAGDYAMGGLAIAPHIQGEITKRYFETSSFFRIAKTIAEHSRWFLLLTLLPALQGLWRWRKISTGHKADTLNPLN